MPSNPKNVRRCCACHEHDDKSNMIRFVKTPEGDVVLDDRRTMDGRGVWVHREADCIAKLKKKRLLDVAFKTRVGENVYGELDER